MPSGDVPVCYNNDSSTLTCMTTEGPLEWIDSNSMSRLFNQKQDPVVLGNLNLSVVSVAVNVNQASLSVTSTATIIDNFLFLSSMSNNLTVRCRETSTDITKQSTFIKAGKCCTNRALLFAGFYSGGQRAVTPIGPVLMASTGNKMKSK